MRSIGKRPETRRVSLRSSSTEDLASRCAIGRGPSNAEELAERMPRARVRIVEDAGHGSGSATYLAEIVRATDDFARDDPRVG